MKDQYFGDIGDYGKYGLLRFIASHDMTIAVNWYLTPYEPFSNDGNMRGYLERDSDRKYDPELFDIIKGLCAQGQRSVRRFEDTGAISKAIYYSKPMPSMEENDRTDRLVSRKRWHEEARNACSKAELVFLDPDIGLRDGKPSTARDAEKYVYASEICDYYDAGQDVVYYCHRGRRKEELWKKARLVMKTHRPDAALFCLTYHRGTQRSFIFVVHPERAEQYRKMIDGFLETAWIGVFSEESCLPDSLGEKKPLITYEDAVATIPLGKYRHFKGMEYEVLAIARHSETENAMVVYRALYGDYGVWVRPAEMWNEEIYRDGRMFKRFEKME